MSGGTPSLQTGSPKVLYSRWCFVAVCRDWEGMNDDQIKEMRSLIREDVRLKD